MGAHQHEHGHAATSAANRRRLWIVFALTGGYLITEVVGGLLTNSLALLSDAGHMLTDLGALGVALFALWFAQRPPTQAKTYGFARIEIIAALFNGLALLVLSGVIIFEALQRLRDPQPVQGLGLLLVAIGGLVVNIIGIFLLEGGHSHSLNIRAAFYHIIGDALGSVATIVAGVLILWRGWTIADPILAIAIALLVIISAVALVREAVDVLLEATPAHLDLTALRAALLQVDGVEGVHDLHAWTLTSGVYALSCHVVVGSCQYTCSKLEELRALLHDEFGISHQTIQIETAELAEEEDVHW